VLALPSSECRDYHRKGECLFQKTAKGCNRKHDLPPLFRDPRFK
jgi:hypothetical protein